jgi:hypothetical protein
MEHFLFHKLKKKQALKLETIQYRAIRGSLGHRISTPANVMLAEAKEIPILVGSDSWEGTMCPGVIRQAIIQWSTYWKN